MYSSYPLQFFFNNAGDLFDPRQSCLISLRKSVKHWTTNGTMQWLGYLGLLHNPHTRTQCIASSTQLNYVLSFAAYIQYSYVHFQLFMRRLSRGVLTCSEFEGWYLYLLSWLLLRGHQCGNITILNYVPIKLHKTGIRTGLHIQRQRSSKSNDIFNIYFLVPKILLTKKNIFFTSTVPTPQVLKICPHQIVFAIKVL